MDHTDEIAVDEAIVVAASPERVWSAVADGGVRIVAPVGCARRWSNRL